MIKKRLRFSIDEIKKDNLLGLSAINNSIDCIITKQCGVGLGSYSIPIRLIRFKLQKDKIMNDTNQLKLNLVSFYLILKHMPLSKELEPKRKKAINCFERIIKKEFNLTLNNLKYYHKYIFKVEPRLINNLKNYNYFRY